MYKNVYYTMALMLVVVFSCEAVCHLEGPCSCQHDRNKALIVECSCKPGQLLNFGWIPGNTTRLRIADCNGTVIMQAGLMQNMTCLEYVVFSKINILVLESGSLEFIHNNKSISITLNEIRELTLKENSILIEMKKLHNSFNSLTIKNSILLKMPYGGIRGSHIDEVIFENIVLLGGADSNALSLGSHGSKVYLSSLDTGIGVLASNWINGHLLELQVVNSRINTDNGSFSSVVMTGSQQHHFILDNNQLGFSQWYLDGTIYMNPSLPSGVFSLQLSDATVVEVSASNNTVDCSSCSSLQWLLEREKSKVWLSFKMEVELSFQCSSGHLPLVLLGCGRAPSFFLLSNNGVWYTYSGTFMILCVLLPMLVYH